MPALVEPQYRGKHVYSWLHRAAPDFAAMAKLPRSLREQLADRVLLTCPTVVRKQESALDGTVKYLWRLYDGNCVETVLMRYHHGNTVCISSEVGCPMGCAFCASTIGGLVRRLSAGEICEHFPVTAAAISRHLSVLREADLIRDQREGKFIYYELNTSVLEEIMLWLTELKGEENERT